MCVNVRVVLVKLMLTLTPVFFVYHFLSCPKPPPFSSSSSLLFLSQTHFHLLGPSSSPSFSFFVPAVTGKPFFIVSSFSHRWLFGWEGCQFYGWAGFFFGCGSLITLTMVSLDRYLKICHLSYGMSVPPLQGTQTMKFHVDRRNAQICMGWLFLLE